jgi:putative NADH-flavin reductase
MKEPILGATGGTGREIVREAGAQGHSVVALVRSNSRAVDIAGAELVEGDARDEQALSRALEGCSGVISSLGTATSPFREERCGCRPICPASMAGRWHVATSQSLSSSS